MKYIMKFVSIHQCRGASSVLRGGGGGLARGLVFSRGRGGFSKKYSKILSTFV